MAQKTVAAPIVRSGHQRVLWALNQQHIGPVETHALPMTHKQGIVVSRALHRKGFGWRGPFFVSASWKAMGKCLVPSVVLLQETRAQLHSCHCDTHRGGMYHCLILSKSFAFHCRCGFFDGGEWEGVQKLLFGMHKTQSHIQWVHQSLFSGLPN